MDAESWCTMLYVLISTYEIMILTVFSSFASLPVISWLQVHTTRSSVVANFDGGTSNPFTRIKFSPFSTFKLALLVG